MEGEALIRTLIRRLLVHGICNFEDGIKTAVRELVERTFNEHSFKAYLYNYSALSQTEHEPQGGEPMSAELDEQYKRLRRLLATAWRTKRSGISREMPLTM